MTYVPRRAVIREDFLAGEKLREAVVELGGRSPVENEAWHIVGDPGEPPFTNGWVNVAGYNPCSFFATPSGLVYLRGTVQNSAAPPPMTSIFTLPVGYRPPPDFDSEQHFARMLFSFFNYAYGSARVAINTDLAAAPGHVRISDYTFPPDVTDPTNPGLLLWELHLDGIMFRTT